MLQSWPSHSVPRHERNEDRSQVEKKNMSAFVVFVLKQINNEISEARLAKVSENTKCHQKLKKRMPSVMETLGPGIPVPQASTCKQSNFGFLCS